MKKSIMRATLPSDRPVVRMLDVLAKAGFQGVQLGIDRSHDEVGLSSTPAQIARLRRQCEEAGLPVHSIYGGGGQFIQADPAGRKRAVEDGLRTLEIAQALGAATWLIHPGQLTPATRYDRAYAWVREGLEALRARAEATHVKIAQEEVWNKFCYSPLEMRRLLDEVGGTHVGCFFDVGNIVPFGYPEHWIEILGKRIFAIHLKDFARAIGTIAGFVPLFHGDVNWPAVMRALRGVGYDDYLISEVSLSHEPLDAALKALSASMDQVIAAAGA